MSELSHHVNNFHPGMDVSNAPMLKEVASEREVNTRCLTLVSLLYLPDSSHLLPPKIYRYAQIIEMNTGLDLDQRNAGRNVFLLSVTFFSTVILSQGLHL